MNTTTGVAMVTSHRGLRAAFITVTTLFFAWGFITATIDPLIPAVRAIFTLSYTESLLTQFAFFLAYGVVSLPGAALVTRIGYGRAIIVALLTMIVGCLVIPLATNVGKYELVLVALFIIASGITVLQVAANPLAAALGPPERSHFRLVFSQAFNSLGTVIAPYLGSVVMLSGGMFAAKEGAEIDAAMRSESLRSIDTAFFYIVGMLLLLTILIWRFRKRMEDAAPSLAAGPKTSVFAALTSRWAVFGAAAIFLYVGAEVSIGSIMINFLHQPDVLDVPLAQAGKLLSFYWLGAMVGRFAGSALLTRVSAARLLSIFALVAAVLCLVVSQTGGGVAAYAVIAVGLFNSIMFPVIYTLTLERSTASQAATSGLLCMAIVGGAILPLIVGQIADKIGLHAAYLVPMVAYAVISVFALGAGRARVAANDPATTGLAH
ncbi:MAG TPA: sugar MFS transporter [Steroidobacteraceae bacterium]|nr:sugar MFS transporter [Steroidobacteraceae bacterium]